MKDKILERLGNCPWGSRLHWFDSIDSTNTAAKEMARNGAPHGTVLIAGHQSAGRGRMGRSFSSEAGLGVYLSVILRPECPPEQLMHLTCAAGVAMCQAVENCCGIRPGLKWINDLVADSRKLGGILTELGLNCAGGNVDFAVVGIGINCSHTTADFPLELQSMATSLHMLTGKDIAVADLAAAMIRSLYEMELDPQRVMEIYRKNCITLGQTVQLHSDHTVRTATALDVDDQGALLVEFPDGSRQFLFSGEAHVRGLYGYI